MSKKPQNAQPATPANDETPNDDNGAENQNANQPEASEAPFVVHAQYLVDYSFENKVMVPYLRGEIDPKFRHEMEWALEINHLEEHNFQVVLRVEVTAHSASQNNETQGEPKVAYIIELFYGAVVSINPQLSQHTDAILQVEIPNILYPFVRQIIADSTLRASYPAIFIPPINFREKFLSNMTNS